MQSWSDKSCAEHNRIRKAIYAAIDACMDGREFLPGADQLYNAIYQDCERRAQAGLEPIFGADHAMLIDRYTQPAPWQRAQDPRKGAVENRRSHNRTEVREAVLKALRMPPEDAEMESVTAREKEAVAA